MKNHDEHKQPSSQKRTANPRQIIDQVGRHSIGVGTYQTIYLGSWQLTMTSR